MYLEMGIGVTCLSWNGDGVTCLSWNGDGGYLCILY